MVVAAGADFMKLGVSNCIQLGMLEQAARLIPQAAIATTRFMTNTIHSHGPNGPLYKSLNCDGEADQCPPPCIPTGRLPDTVSRGQCGPITVNLDLTCGFCGTLRPPLWGSFWRRHRKNRVRQLVKMADHPVGAKLPDG